MPLPKNRVTITCVNCGEIHEIKASRLNKSRRHFCSATCRDTFCGKEKRKYPLLVGNCLYCGGEIIAKYPGMNKASRKFCSYSCNTSYKNKNLPVSKERRKKASERMKNLWLNEAYRKKMSSEERKNKLSNINSGSKSHFWIDGRTDKNRTLRSCAKYKDWRKAVFLRDNFTCQVCKKRNVAGLNLVLNADHIKPWSQFPELRFDINNGRTLCLECHLQTPTFGSKTNQKSYLHN